MKYNGIEKVAVIITFIINTIGTIGFLMDFFTKVNEPYYLKILFIIIGFLNVYGFIAIFKNSVKD